ncbi:MAG: DUF4124 domain-containing protein [Proteobacteria bacterium]|nr:DUF4124 domain-containing protein [Pseudomonadota bacterium]
MKNLYQEAFQNMYIKSSVIVFIITISLIAFSLICTQTIQAGEMYKYTDKDGNTVITNTPNPERYQVKAKKTYSYSEASPSEEDDGKKERRTSYKDILINVEKRKGAHGQACMLCLAEVVKLAETSGKPIQPEFWKIVNSAINNNHPRSMYNQISKAALIQDINLSGIAPCQIARPVFVINN